MKRFEEFWNLPAIVWWLLNFCANSQCHHRLLGQKLVQSATSQLSEGQGDDDDATTTTTRDDEVVPTRCRSSWDGSATRYNCPCGNTRGAFAAVQKVLIAPLTTSIGVQFNQLQFLRRSLNLLEKFHWRSTCKTLRFSSKVYRRLVWWLTKVWKSS